MASLDRIFTLLDRSRTPQASLVRCRGRAPAGMGRARAQARTAALQSENAHVAHFGGERSGDDRIRDV